MWVIHPVLSHNVTVASSGPNNDGCNPESSTDVVIENVFVRDVTIGETGSAIDIDMQYEEGGDGPFAPVVRNLVVERLAVRRADYAFSVRGLPQAPVRGLAVRDSSFLSVSRGSLLEHVEDFLLSNVVIRPSSREPSAAPAP